MNTTNINKKKNTSIRFTLKMLLWAAVGGLLGFLASWFGMQTEMVGRFFSGLTVGIQSIMLPLVIVITVAGIVFGEVMLRKMKHIADQLLCAEDEACDELEYQEERVGSFGLNGSNLVQALCILAVSVGYSRSYLSGTEQNAVDFMLTMAVFLVCFLYEGIWQMRYVKMIQYSHPEFSTADPSSLKFQKQWMDHCDEAEKEVIYHSAYKTLMLLCKVLPIALVFTMLTNLLYDTGIMAVVVLAVIWMVSTLHYTHSCVTMRKKRAKGL